MTRANTAVDKWYSPLYAEFKKTLRLSAEYLDQLYTSAYAGLFYTPEEVAGFWQRWAKA